MRVGRGSVEKIVARFVDLVTDSTNATSAHSTAKSVFRNLTQSMTHRTATPITNRQTLTKRFSRLKLASHSEMVKAIMEHEPVFPLIVKVENASPATLQFVVDYSSGFRNTTKLDFQEALAVYCVADYLCMTKLKKLALQQAFWTAKRTDYNEFYKVLQASHAGHIICRQRTCGEFSDDTGGCIKHKQHHYINDSMWTKNNHSTTIENSNMQQTERWILSLIKEDVKISVGILPPPLNEPDQWYLKGIAHKRIEPYEVRFQSFHGNTISRVGEYVYEATKNMNKMRQEFDQVWMEFIDGTTFMAGYLHEDTPQQNLYDHLFSLDVGSFERLDETQPTRLCIQMTSTKRTLNANFSIV